VRGAEWAAAVKGLHVPTDAPKRAATLSLIPGMGAVYNGEYRKALTQFAIFAALLIMSDEVHGVFGFGAVVFLIFTMFDSYRTAETQLRTRMEPKPVTGGPAKDRTAAAWGIILIGLGLVFLLQNFIHFNFLNRLWPLVFIALGVYLVFGALRDREEEVASGNKTALGQHKE
jgi:fatty acid desaturase